MNRQGGAFLNLLLFVLLLGGCGYYYYALYNSGCFSGNKTELLKIQDEQKILQAKLDALTAQKLEPKVAILGENSNKEVIVKDPEIQHSQSTLNWLKVQKKSKDTVIQVYGQVLDFNWIEPYKTPKQGESSGSGFFINQNGDIITNYHVVAQSSNIQIQIPTFGMERFEAELIGASPERDIALLRLTEDERKKIEEKINPIPFLELGNSDEVMRSQEVLALGYPLGQTRLKSTLGIVSGRERLGYFGYIQVTTPLNPGNSGGPAINADGKVIGINSRGVLEAQNVGYIIPINEVKSALDDLYHVKLLRKPTLGCIFTMATAEMVGYLNNPSEGGWYIAKVFDQTLLKSVGIKEDDMLYEVNGHKIDMYGELNVPWSEDKVSLFELLNRYKVGDMLNFLIYRKGTPHTYSFKLEHKYLPPIRTIYAEFEPEYTKYEIIGGMVIMNLTINHIGILLGKVPELVRYGRIENQHEQALIITHVLPNSQAYKARVLQQGEIIDTVNGVKVKNLDDFRAAILKGKKSGYITVRTSDNLYGVLSIKKILKEEKELSARFFYPISPLVKELEK